MGLMKICNICGKEASEEMRFCPYCGKSSFSINNDWNGISNYENKSNKVNDNMKEIYNQNQYRNQYQYESVRTSQPFNNVGGNTEKAETDTTKRGNFVGLLVLAVVTMAVITFAFMPNGLNVGGLIRHGCHKLVYFDSPNKKDVASNDKKRLDGSSAVEYTKGEISDNAYTNKWLGIKLNFPEGFSNASVDKYDGLTNETTECGLCILDDNNNNIMCLLEKTDGSYSVDDYASLLENNFTGTNSGYVKQGEDTLVSVGLEYKVIKYKLSLNGVSINQNVYITKKDKVFVTFMFTMSENIDSDDLMKSIQQFN